MPININNFKFVIIIAGLILTLLMIFVQNCLLITSAVYIPMHYRLVLSHKQTLWEQSDLGLYWPPKYISKLESRQQL